MATLLTVAINGGTPDTAYTGSSPWVDLDTANDYLIFSNGSTSVADGQVIPTAAQLSQAGAIVQTSDYTIPKYILADISENLLVDIENAGDQDKQYVFAFSFDGATTTEPVLEVWDDSSMNSYDSESLGGGTYTDSWVRGVVTTSGSPGVSWTGTRLSGSADGYFLLLNDGSGAITGATVLYCNLKVVIPANFTTSGTETPTFVCKYTTN